MSKYHTVKMTKNQDGSPDGVHIRTYEEGQTYDLPEDLARAFVEDLKCAEHASRAPAKAPNETPEKPKGKRGSGKRGAAKETPENPGTGDTGDGGGTSAAQDEAGGGPDEGGTE